MILPISAYGSPVLRKIARDITPDYANLKELIDNMFETMYAASGVGLAAPQIGLDIRLFVVDSLPMFDDDDDDNHNSKQTPKNIEQGIKQVFINAKIIQVTGKPWNYTEGCLSIPHVREEVKRQSDILISYLDENFKPHRKIYTGLNARVIQHEYDHIEGKLFIDYLSPLKKRLLQRRLDKIAKGDIDVNYKMRFPTSQKR